MGELKTWCIEFTREIEGKDVIHVKQEDKPTEEEAYSYILDQGYIFHVGYDEIDAIYEV
jgi:hypothetical protein